MRTLAIAALSFSAAVFAACYLLPLGGLLYMALALAIFGAALLLPRRKWLRAFVLACFASAVGMLAFYAHAQFTAVPAAALDGETREIQALVVSYPQDYDSYTRVEVRLETEGLPRVTALLYDSAKSLAEARPGQRIVGEGRIRPADTRYC